MKQPVQVWIWHQAVSYTHLDVYKRQDKLFKVFNKRAVNYSDCSMDDLVYAISKGRSFVAQRKNGTYVLVMSYNQTDLRYYDPTNGKSVKACLLYTSESKGGLCRICIEYFTD